MSRAANIAAPARANTRPAVRGVAGPALSIVSATAPHAIAAVPTAKPAVSGSERKMIAAVAERTGVAPMTIAERVAPTAPTALRRNSCARPGARTPATRKGHWSWSESESRFVPAATATATTIAHATALMTIAPPSIVGAFSQATRAVMNVAPKRNAASRASAIAVTVGEAAKRGGGHPASSGASSPSERANVGGRLRVDPAQIFEDDDAIGVASGLGRHEPIPHVLQHEFDIALTRIAEAATAGEHDADDVTLVQLAREQRRHLLFAVGTGVDRAAAFVGPVPTLHPPGAELVPARAQPHPEVGERAVLAHEGRPAALPAGPGRVDHRLESQSPSPGTPSR